MQSSNTALSLLVRFAALLFAAAPALASDQPFTLHLELGAGWQEKNTVQIPNDEQGTRFSLADLAGSGPWTAIRVEGTWDINDKHGLRFLLAPLSYSESGQLETETRFAGQSYSPDEKVKAEYSFNSWRLGYRTLEGGADTDDVYNFAWFNSLVFSADYRF